MTRTILLFGPTASGKTDLSIKLAQKIEAEIISADSMQVYRHMDIGTAKPSIEQRALVPHHLIDIVDPDMEWTVSDFIGRAEAHIKDIEKSGKVPLIVGGTGLYLNAFIHGFSFPIAAKDESIRTALSALLTEELFSKLENVDPKAAGKINKNDRKRLIRALEVFEQTGTPISSMQKSKTRSSLTLLCLDMERKELYERINARVDKMLLDGLVDEVRTLLNKGYHKGLQSMQALGYKEVIDYFDGKYAFDDMVELIKKRTRNFARRQLTWFRRFPDVKWIESGSDIMSSIDSLILS